MDTLIAIVPSFLAAGFGLALFFLARHINVLRTNSTALTAIPGVEHYRPMLRLLDERDFQYLAESGCPADVIRKARSNRRTVFRRYLRSLVKDYSRLLAGLRMRILMSEVERPDLLRAVAVNRFLLIRSLLQIEFHLALHVIGIGKVDVSGLLQSIETLKAVSASLPPAAA